MNGQNTDQDRRLKRLIEEIKKHPPQSKKWQKAFAKLFKEISESPQLFRQHSSQLAPHDRYVFNEAKQDFFLYISEHIHSYDPQRCSVMGWVNMLLERRFIKRAYAKLKPDIIPIAYYDLDRASWLNGASDREEEEELSLMEMMKQYIDLDPQGVFRSTHIKNCPEANYQSIALQYLAGKSWQAMSEDFQVKLSTLSSFYCRQTRRFAETIRQACQIY